MTNRYWNRNADDARLLEYADSKGRLTVPIPELSDIFQVSNDVLYANVRRLGLSTHQKRGLWTQRRIEALINLCDPNGRLTLPLRDAAAYFGCSVGTVRQQVRKLMREGRIGQAQPPAEVRSSEPQAIHLPDPEYQPQEDGPGPAVLIVYAFMLAWGIAIGFAAGAYMF